MSYQIGQKVRVLDSPQVRRWEPWSFGRVGEVTSALVPHFGIIGRFGHHVLVDGERLFFAPDEIVPVDDGRTLGSWYTIEELTKWNPQRITVSEEPSL